MEIFIGIVVIYIVYLILTAKSRRRKEIFKRLNYMVTNGYAEMEFNDIFFDACKGYALDNGGYADNSGASVDVLINGRRWTVTFINLPSRKTVSFYIY